MALRNILNIEEIYLYLSFHLVMVQRVGSLWIAFIWFYIVASGDVCAS